MKARFPTVVVTFDSVFKPELDALHFGICGDRFVNGEHLRDELVELCKRVKAATVAVFGLEAFDGFAGGAAFNLSAMIDIFKPVATLCIIRTYPTRNLTA